MISVHGYYENGVCVPTETLELKDRQQVIITVVEESATHDKESLFNMLESFRGSMRGTWGGEDPVEYQRRLREDRIV